MDTNKLQTQPKLLIHGGAETFRHKPLTPKLERAYLQALNNALKVGYKILVNEGSSLEAVTQSLISLENCPLFNAGTGSVLTQKGAVECDAAIMDGSTLKAGAVAGVSLVKNPVVLAKLIMEKSRHILLVGKHAERFAYKQGMKLIETQQLITEQQYSHWMQLKQTIASEKTRSKYGTVGAVALDCAGHLAAATSTGGIMNKVPGRVGDSPIIGAGTYANNQTCAVSGTGEGEYFMRLLLSYDLAAQLEYKQLSLIDAALQSIKKLTSLGGKGGFIAIDRFGNVAMPFNTEAMYRGMIDKEKSFCAIYP